MLRIGIDLGGTKTEALALDEAGRERCRKRVATPRGSYDEILSALVALIESVEAECGERGSIGLGIPGITSPASTVSRPPSAITSKKSRTANQNSSTHSS